MSPVHASLNKPKFLVGTCSVLEKNEVTLLEYVDESNELDPVAVMYHPDQVVALESCPTQELLLASSGLSTNGAASVNIWKLPSERNDDKIARTEHSSDLKDDNAITEGANEDEDGRFGSDLQHVSSFAFEGNGTSSATPLVWSIQWDTKGKKVLTLDGQCVSVFGVGEGSVVQEAAGELVGDEVEGVETEMQTRTDMFHGACAWDPHSESTQLAVAFASQLQVLDIRTMGKRNASSSSSRSGGGIHIAGAHTGGITDVDFNPSRQYVVATTGRDRCVRVWDIRKNDAAVCVLRGHSHWGCCVRYNPVHDQLILSGGSDHAAMLWRVASHSSSPWLCSPSEDTNEQQAGSVQGGDATGDSSNDPPDTLTKVIDQHEDSIYSVAWSRVDPWVFASLSFDGRIVLSHVPSAEKYKILL
jgi:WD40 repeat protein